MMSGHILLCPNPSRDIALEVTRRAKRMLEEAGHIVRISPLFGRGMEDELVGELRCEKLEDALPGAQLAVTLGGDGTILHAAQVMLGRNVPILGINLGHKGFLTELEVGELELLREAAEGRYELDRRMMLEVGLLREGETVFRGFALNDAAINGIVNTVRLTAFADGRKITEFSGDGIIVASPTGSTAYSMAAGGPLVEPQAESLLITPICAHRLAARSFVLSPERVVTVRPVEVGKRRVLLSLDGDQQTALRDGDTVCVRRSENVLMMARLNGKSFYDIAYEKLSDQG